MYAVVMLGGTGLMLGAMTCFHVVDRRNWPMRVFRERTVAAFVFGFAAVRLLRDVVSEDAIHIRCAWGSRKTMLADLGEMRDVNLECGVKRMKRRGRWL